MKLNKKGFMMAEVIVVSSIVLITLTSLYISYNKIYSTYKKRINYYDVSIIYDLDKIRRNVVIDAPTNNTKIENDVISESNTTVYAIPLPITDNKITDLSQENTTFNTTFNEYLKYLKNSITVNNCNYILVMEKCDEANKGCKYGYLESEECIK